MSSAAVVCATNTASGEGVTAIVTVLAGPDRLLPSFSVDTARTLKEIVPLKLASRTTRPAAAISAGVPDQTRLAPTPPMNVSPCSETPVGTPETTTVTDSEPSLSIGVTAVSAPDRAMRRPAVASTVASVVVQGELIAKLTGSATPRTSTSKGKDAVVDVLVMPSETSTDTAETVSGISALLLSGGVIVSFVAGLKLAIDTLPPTTVWSTPP